jgi:PrtD family type I secretion system ABC transporter
VSGSVNGKAGVITKPFDFASTMGTYKAAFLAVGLMSGIVNVLALTGSFYMLQVYDRVLPSRSVPTLVGLTIMMLVLFVGYGVLDFLRTRIMARVGLKIDNALRARVFDAVLMLPLRARKEAGGLQPIRDLDSIRTFLSSLGPTALFDIPWLPLSLLLLALMHPLFGAFALASALLLVVITLMTEAKTAKPMKDAVASGASRMIFAESSRRNAEVIHAMGMGGGASKIWTDVNGRHLDDQLKASDATSGLSTASKIIRMVLQSGMLGLGAYLAILGQISAGAIIAGTIILGRALAPIELAIAHWKGFVSARQGYARLKTVMKVFGDAEREQMPLPRPVVSLELTGVSVGPPGEGRAIVQNASFALKAGSGLGIIGPSASGKSTLVRVIVGVWLPLGRAGSVRLDGATLDQYNNAALGRDIGYLPQDIELFDGTVSYNIARMEHEPSSEAVIKAAQLAGCHDMILQLPDGYNTRVGEGGSMLSAGQRQRVALARALYGDPFLVVLDEPNSNLDTVGDLALSNAIKSVRERQGIVIIVAHRPSALSGVDQLLAMANGQVQAFGPKEEVLGRVLQQQNGQAGLAPGTQPNRGVPELKVVSADPASGQGGA